MDMVTILERLTAAYGPSGQEGAVARVIEELAGPYCDKIRRDTMGNLICRIVWAIELGLLVPKLPSGQADGLDIVFFSGRISIRCKDLALFFHKQTFCVENQTVHIKNGEFG